MINFINKELFKVTTEKVSNEHGEYYKTDVTTAMNVLKKQDKKPGKQIITKIISPSEDYNAENTAINTLPLNSGRNRVSIKSSERNKYDSRIYMLALPFNGFAEPLEDTHLYKIHKGMIARSPKRNIGLNGLSYKKVLYLMLTLNEAVFAEDHKYHTDEIVLKFVSYNLESKQDGEAENATTVKTTITVTFTADGVDYEMVSETVDPVNPDDFKGKRLFRVFEKKSAAQKKDNYEKHQVEKSDEKPTSAGKTDLDDMIAQYQKDASRNEKSRNRKGGKKKRR